MIIIASLMSCNPLKHYKKVESDSTGRSKEKIDILSKVCAAQFPVHAKQGTETVSNIYSENLEAEQGCGYIIDSLNAIIANGNNTHLNIDSIKTTLLRTLIPQKITIYKYRVDTVPDLAALRKAQQETECALNEAMRNGQASENANIKLQEFESNKGNLGTSFKWFINNLIHTWWFWIIVCGVTVTSVIKYALKNRI
jgi:hypothetical protein